LGVKGMRCLYEALRKNSTLKILLLSCKLRKTDLYLHVLLTHYNHTQTANRMAITAHQYLLRIMKWNESITRIDLESTRRERCSVTFNVFTLLSPHAQKIFWEKI